MARAGRTSWWPQQAAGPVIIQDAAGNYLRLPKLTTTQRDALTAVNGMLIFNSTTAQVEEYNGSWQAAGRKYADATFMPFTGGAFTGTVNFGDYLPTNIRALARALFKGEVKAIPLTPATGWTATGVNGGGSVSSDPFRMTLRATAAVAPNSSIVSDIAAFGLNTDGAQWNYIDWDKDLLVACVVAISGSNAAAERFIQVKTASTLGELAALGIEFRLANLALKGNAYGTSLGTEVDLATSLTADRPSLLAMFLNASGVEWFVNNVSKGTLTTANKFPTGMGAATASVVFSNDNGGTATQTDLYVGNIWIVQEV